MRYSYTLKGKGIEEAENKEIFGHWELDTVVGKQKTKAAFMVMTERSKGIEIIRKIESKSQECIVRGSSEGSAQRNSGKHSRR